MHGSKYSMDGIKKSICVHKYYKRDAGKISEALNIGHQD